jgi:hypothetical protein
VGVIWGEGMADHRRPVSRTGFHAYLERMLRTVRRWLFMNEDEGGATVEGRE